MTIPSCEDALKAVIEARNLAMEKSISARIPECGDFGLIAQNLDFGLDTLRSYIESHTGEVVAWTTPSEFSELQAGITARMWKDPARGRDIALYASPVQPDHIADAGKKVAVQPVQEWQDREPGNGKIQCWTCVGTGTVEPDQSDIIAGLKAELEKLKAERDEWKASAADMGQQGIGIMAEIARLKAAQGHITARQVIDFMERETGVTFGDMIGLADRDRIVDMANSIGDK